MKAPFGVAASDLRSEGGGDRAILSSPTTHLHGVEAVGCIPRCLLQSSRNASLRRRAAVPQMLRGAGAPIHPAGPTSDRTNVSPVSLRHRCAAGNQAPGQCNHGSAGPAFPRCLTPATGDRFRTRRAPLIRSKDRSERQDLNLRPPDPQSGIYTFCAGTGRDKRDSPTPTYLLNYLYFCPIMSRTIPLSLSAHQRYP